MVDNSLTAARSPRIRLPTSMPGVVAILAVMCIGFFVLDRRFVSVANLRNIGDQSAVLLTLATPMTLVVMTEGVDISVGAVLGLVGVVLGLMLTHGWGLSPALCVASCVGLAFGGVNGASVAYLRMPPFLVTLSTMSVAQGLSLGLTDGAAVGNLPSSLTNWYGVHLLGVPAPILVSLAFFGAVYVILYKLRFGRYVVALGGNPEALMLAGVRARLCLTAVYLIVAAGATLGAVLMCARLDAAHPTLGIGMEFEAIAAVVLGGTSLEGGKGWLFGTLLGVLAIGVARNGLDLLGIQSSVQVVFVGLLVILALTIDGATRGRA
jgi:ribose transport system permease protein